MGLFFIVVLLFSSIRKLFLSFIFKTFSFSPNKETFPILLSSNFTCFLKNLKIKILNKIKSKH